MRATARAALTLSALAMAACRAAGGARLIEEPVPVFRGHQDLHVSGNQAIPWVLGRTAPVGICVAAPADADTSQWEARLFENGFVRAAARLGTSVCFEAPVPKRLEDGTHRLCALLRDRFDGASQSLPCVAFRLDTDDAPFRALEKRIPEALAGPASRLDGLAADAETQGYPALALRIGLIAAYTLRREGTPDARASAARHLEGAPPWIDDPAAARWAGQLAYEKASLALDQRTDLAGCWRLLRSAENSFRSGVDRKWIAVVGKQAEVLSRVGALDEARQRLRTALSACASAPCDEALVRAEESTWTWLIASDPDAGDEELGTARHQLALLEPPKDPLEHANVLLNLAFLDLRLGRDPGPMLREARTLVRGASSARARELAGWAELAEARQALSEGKAAQAAASCDRLAASDLGDRLRAFALGGAAAARRTLGDLEGARTRLAQARELHARSSAGRLGQDVPLGPGQRAEDAYAAARIELERGRPSAAWELLRALDDDAAAARGEPAALPPVLRGQRDAVRSAELDRLQERVRTRDTGGPRRASDAGVAFRAFPVEDEVIVLRRMPAGAVEPYRRTPFRRAELIRAVGAVRESVDRAERADGKWRIVVGRLAAALAPEPEDLGPVTTFALHGILQEVPLAALQAGPRWLGQLTTVVTHAAGSHDGRGDELGATVVVSDPRGDLGLPEPERGTGIRILHGSAATREALRDALAGATRLHVDAHARYEPAFPELSTIVLADGPVTGQELAAWGTGLTLANLSGCQTGRSPITADSGRYGIAGLLASRGTTWVVGTRAPLDNALALEFNRAFYASLSAGDGVPAAYRKALDEVRRTHPASQWAVLLLLHAPEEKKREQSPEPRTPSNSGEGR
jgi:hypothetical protein